MNKFIKGMDLSTMLEEEQCGAKYYDHGEEKDILQIMKEHDVDTIRVRLWNDPKSPEGEPYGAGNNGLEEVIRIGKRITEAGLGMLLDFHYSDFWADPGKQFKPKAWAHYNAEELKDAVYDFTKASVQAICDEGIHLTMIQVGNELTNGLLWPEGRLDSAEGYRNCAAFVSAGIRACREAHPNIPLMIHLDNGGNNELYRRWFDRYFENGGADFDYIGLSYYPLWHGSLQMLEDNMNDIAVRYGKDLIVAEVSAGFTMEDYSQYEKLEPEERKGHAIRQKLLEGLEYPISVQGQGAFMKDFLQRISHIEEGRGRGFFWWEPAWIPVPGSGWATPASLAYIQDPGPCGNEWANQALFDYDGNKLPTLEIIRDFSA